VANEAPQPAPPASIGRIPVVEVSPVIEGGRWPAKAAVGEVVPVEATVFREGHDAVAANTVLYSPNGNVFSKSPMVDVAPGLARYLGFVQPDSEGDWTFAVEAWSDPYGTWLHDASVKFEAGVDKELMVAEGELLLRRILESELVFSEYNKAALDSAAAVMADTSRSLEDRFAALATGQAKIALIENPLRDLVSVSPKYPLRVSRRETLFGAWYEIFPRSEGAYQDESGNWISGNLRTATQRLPDIAKMGFDVVYLTPIHPIGSQFKKGKNNSLDSVETDPGSPYAIGSADGGHDAIHPDLGNEEDFKAFVAAANENGMEVALDIALQCSPDHPWVKEHPEWFKIRADGTIAYAENPPKKYQDIYPLFFDLDPVGLRNAIYEMIMHWIKLGVKNFRVDNPHTKPLDFWEWLLNKVHETNPEVIFLSEAFTKPPMMQTLAKVGFQQSYTYFTWRNSKEELEEYLTEVSGEEGSNLRPSFWPTTHDILPPYLQHGGAAGFAVRAVLAATGSPLWGIYTGYELVENVPRPGVEEQVDNEKYEYKQRNWDQADSIGVKGLLTRLNEIRRAHPALQQLRNLTIQEVDNPNVIAYSKRVRAQDLKVAADPKFAIEVPEGQDDTILVIVNLDPWGTQEASLHLDLNSLGLVMPDGWVHQNFRVKDLLTGDEFYWNANPFVRLEPRYRVAHILQVIHD
jgi:starch synthase (maltosyl-transferring)